MLPAVITNRKVTLSLDHTNLFLCACHLFFTVVAKCPSSLFAVHCFSFTEVIHLLYISSFEAIQASIKILFVLPMHWIGCILVLFMGNSGLLFWPNHILIIFAIAMKLFSVCMIVPYSCSLTFFH